MGDRAAQRTPQFVGSRPRWWPALAVLGVLGLWLAWTWLGAETPDRQTRVLRTVAGCVLAAISLATWVLVASRLRWRTRAVVLAAVGLLALAGFASLEIRGVSGDVVPLIDWRWAERPADRAVSSGPIAAPAGVVVPDGAAGFEQFLGPSRDGRLAGPALARDWAARPPREVWRRAVGSGWSGFAVAEGIAVTQEQRADGEYVAAYALADGTPLWAAVDAGGHDDPLGGPGPRATPSIAAGRVFAFGGRGRLTALELRGGRRIWSRDVYAASAAELPMYGVSASPLVIDGSVVVAPGGRGTALSTFAALDGEPRWSAGDGAAGYSSPVLLELLGAPQLVVFNDAGLTAHRPADGLALWSAPWPAETQKTSQPVAVGTDRVFVSSGYGVGGTLFELAPDAESRIAARELWSSRALKAKFANVVERDGFLYGLDDGILTCVDAADGRRRWKAGRYGHGQLLLVGDLLLVMAERGDVALVEAIPDAFTELGRFTALTDKTWNHPALAGRYLLVRNDREAACFELPLINAGGTARAGHDGT